MGRDKKHKKKHKKDKKRRKERKYSSSSSSNSSDEEWVEHQIPVSKEKDTELCNKESNDWLQGSDDLFATVTRSELRQRNKPIEKEEPKASIDTMGQSERELNPYWKDGGTGLPENFSETPKMVGAVGDMGLNWLKRALARAKQRAAEENKSLEEIVAPTWGSLAKLQELIDEAELKAKGKCSSRNKHYRRSPEGRGDSRLRRDELYKKQRDSYDSKDRQQETDRSGDRSNDSSHSRDPRYGFRKPDDEMSSGGSSNSVESSTSRLKFRKPDDDTSRERSPKESLSRRPAFMKPSDDSNTSFRSSLSSHSRNYHHSGGESFAGFRKPTDDSSERKKGWRKHSSPKRTSPPPREAVKSDSPVQSKSPEVKCKSPSRSPSPEEKPEILTEDEMNKLGAKIIKAEMLGNMELAQTLQKKLRRAQAWLDGKSKKSSDKPEEIILTRTDNKGFTHPVSASTSAQPSKAKKTKIETHEGGQRVRYFADDDKYSLNDLYQQEKFISASDGNEIYSRMASKGVGRDGSARDMDDMFEETARVDKGDEWKEFREKQRAVWENDKREKALDACQRCINNNSSLRQLVVSIQDKVYLCVPPYGSIVEGHCLIIPNQHIASATLLDEDVWEEINDMKKLLVKMFAEDDEDIIFYENVRNLNKLPHMVIHCVPVPRETGDVAPIYFKKALLECETEWSNNKKVVDLKGRDIRKAVPKGLPYFCVDFGLQSGFAHVIEDEQLFPRNFAEEIIGGMMDLDHSRWRKQKKDDSEVLKTKAQALIKKFKEFMAKS